MLHIEELCVRQLRSLCSHPAMCFKEIWGLGKGKVHCWRVGGVCVRRGCLLHMKLVIGNFSYVE